jgi:phosphoglycerate dehydrogenase-like enzyme
MVATTLNVLIATPLEPELVETIASCRPEVDVRYERDLLPPTRYRGDHRGCAGFHRTRPEQDRWDAMLTRAHVTFGIPGDDPAELGRLVRASTNLRFVQATAAGAGQQVAAADLSAADLERVAIASSSGVHAGPLAEFALAGILAFARGLPRLQADRAARQWDHYPTRDVAGRTAVILGIGSIGSRIATMARALGMHVVGVNSDGRGTDAPVDEFAAADALPRLAVDADVLIITLPATSGTTRLVDAAVLSSLPAGAIVVNVGRGTVLDEAALIDLLRAGHLGGAVLDVAEDEPPKPTSDLWDLPNVILSPHTAALSPHENGRIVDLFIDNLRRLQIGAPIRNRITAAKPY